ncbi:MAG: signal peptide peptidase SppA [Candidatus Komeilibacteria bacterium]|nr:signal peptide peptidase SppA [Candidatus Komeilibacteria bacterium]
MKNLRLSILMGILVITSVIFYRQMFAGHEANLSSSQNQEPTTNATTTANGVEGDFNDSNTDCNVARVKINNPIDVEEVYYNDNGDVTASSENIVKKLEEIGDNDNWKAVLLAINSPGGDPVASEEIANAVKRLAKPVVAVIQSIGASGAYMVASAANYIFASRFSDVGSIGVTWSYLDNSVQNKKEGLTYNSLSSGKFKDTLDPDKPLTKEEKDLLMRDVLKSYDLFVKMVAENRKISVAQVKQLADGSTMMGESALANGLIDAIGDEYEAKQWLKNEIKERANPCDYELKDSEL